MIQLPSNQLKHTQKVGTSIASESTYCMMKRLNVRNKYEGRKAPYLNGRVANSRATTALIAEHLHQDN